MAILRRALDALRAIVISPEFAGCGLCYLIWLVTPITFDGIGSRIKADEKLWQLVLALPLLVLPWALVEAKAVLFPVEPSSARRSLHLWPDYWRLKLRVVLALLWILAAAVLSVAVWLFKGDLSDSVAGVLSIGAIVICLIAAGSLWWAAINTKEIVQK